MRKAGYVSLALALSLLLLAGILFLVAQGPGALDSEKVFMAELHNSLYNIDLAKFKWVEEKHKSEQAVPTMEDLAPYLGDWTNRIQRLITLGINYRITPISEMEPQSDIATLTRDLRFRAGICVFYRAGTQYSLHNGWAHSESGNASWLRPFYIVRPDFLAIVLFVLAMVSLLVFIIKRIRNSIQVTRDSS
ncbi:MAG: hypothetical protein HZA90_21055 [Verrucomicrobia bacterium]|nr:hypothetical protein [Verrucomicrobiota bacterium]